MRSGIRLVLSLVFVVVAGVVVGSALGYGPLSSYFSRQASNSQQIEGNLVPKTLDQYSVAELKALATQIKDAPTDKDAHTLAQKYNLLDAQGSLTSITKQFVTSDGKTIPVMLAGIRQDKEAGLSFVTSQAIALHVVNQDGSNDKGWKDSDIRAWLNGEVLSSLPQDLIDAIVSVEKKTNNSDATQKSSGTIETTSDKLWLLSASEIAGDITWFTKDDRSYNNDKLNATMSDQGEQYQVFKDAGVSSTSDPQGVLKRIYQGNPVSWWMRSPYLFSYSFMNSSYFYAVMDSGYPHTFFEPNTEQGVVFGFCL